MSSISNRNIKSTSTVKSKQKKVKIKGNKHLSLAEYK